MTKTLDKLEYTGAQDLFYDFCLWDYKPVTSPENKLRSANLLFHFFSTSAIQAVQFLPESAIP